MSKFRVRAIVEFDVWTSTAADAEAKIRAKPEVKKIIGVVPGNDHWPNEEPGEEKPFVRPPRNTPPSGSPGTPTVGKEPEFVQAVAA